MRTNGWARFHHPDYIAAKSYFPIRTELAKAYAALETYERDRLALLGRFKGTADIGPVFDLPCLLDSKFASLDLCYYCQSPLRQLSDLSLPYNYVKTGSDLSHGYAATRTAFECQECGWWAIETEGHDAVEYGKAGNPQPVVSPGVPGLSELIGVTTRCARKAGAIRSSKLVGSAGAAMSVAFPITRFQNLPQANGMAAIRTYSCRSSPVCFVSNALKAAFSGLVPVRARNSSTLVSVTWPPDARFGSCRTT